MVLVPTRNLSWNVRSEARLVTSRRIVVVVTRKTQMLMVRERGLRTNPKVDAIAWWINSGATTHVFKDRYRFKVYESVEDRYVLYMGDNHFASVHGKGSVVLEFSSKKSITLFNVLYVPKLHKNLISGHVLNKCGYKQVYESDKYILPKYGIFVGFGYCNNAPYTPQQNGVAERKNRALREMVNSMLSYSCLNEGAIVRLPDPKRKTLGEKGIDCIFVGYVEHSKAYRPKDSITNLDESQKGDHSDDVPSEIPEPCKGCKHLGCKWIFKRKMKVDGTSDKFKDRLVIQGFRQKEWIDYFNTYTPVACITIIRLLLALVAIHNLVIHQIDVKTAFLNGDLEEEVYMKQSKGFVMTVDKTKKFLSSRFSMKDIGEADVILGIKIKRKNKGIVITQSYYIEKILKKFNREDCSSVSTPIDLVEKLKPNTGKPVDQLEYSSAIGCLMYVMTSTGPDIAYAVGRLSRFTSNPNGQHWCPITRIFKHLKGTMNYGLSYVGYPSVFEAYSNASWINHVDDSSSISGWVFLLGGGAISWASKKQTCITGSTMESEFVALATTGKEA
nr:zinc finger, CCHC-type [Tanacetum cinerariifolium]